MLTLLRFTLIVTCTGVILGFASAPPPKDPGADAVAVIERSSPI